jgi:hypothetical protein
MELVSFLFQEFCDLMLILLCSQHSPELVPLALDDCLQELGLEYLDVSSHLLYRDSADNLSPYSSTSFTFPFHSRKD